MKFEIISRVAALEAGRKRFYTGKPCKYGHDAQRFVTTGSCVACNAARSSLFAGKVRLRLEAEKQGHFIYMLHPDDHAAALAYCQALDLTRGRTPSQAMVPRVAAFTPRGAEALVLPEDIARRRAELLARHAPQAPAVPYLPREMSGS